MHRIKRYNQLNNITIQGKVPKYTTPLIINYIEYNIELLSINITITVIFKKIDKKEIGFINLSEQGSNGTIFIDKDASYNMMLKYISHELTHIKQIQNGELKLINDDIIWKGKKNINIKDYKKLLYDEYVKLGWEIEADYNQENIIKKYINSGTFNSLKNNTDEPNLKFILQNIF